VRGQLFAWQEVCVLRIVQGQPDAARRCEVPQGSKQKSLAKLRREIAIIQGFSQQVPAYRLAHDLAVDAKVLSRVYPKLRAAIFHVAELEAMESTLSGESELDEAYFGGRRKGKRGRGAAGKSVVLGLLVGYVSP
jgi:transposase